MKLSNKGFMLAEVVIVASVISTVLVFLFISINRMSNAYDTRNRYYDIDAMYAAMAVNDYLIRNNLIETIDTSGELTSVLEQSDYNELEEQLLYLYDGVFISVYYVSYHPNDLALLNSSITNKRALNDYLDYLSDNLDFENEEYEYLIIVELRNETDLDDARFYTLKVKGDNNETE